MKILIASDSPDATSAYALQAWDLAKALHEAGHEIIVNGQTYCGVPQMRDGILIVGNLGILDPYGSSLLLDYYADKYAVDVILTMKDPHVYPLEYMKRLSKPWIAVAPLDTEPPAAMLVNILRYATRVIALTHVAQEALREKGIFSDYAPHAIDCEFYSPGDGSAFRAKYGISPEATLITAIKANRDDPSRGTLDTLMLAWKEFLIKHPDWEAVLALHTDISSRAGGVNLAAMMDVLDIPPHSIFISDQADYQAGFDKTYVRDLLRASDWFFAASMGEGFHVGMVEAAACGVPAIFTDFTALRETNCGGIVIPTDKGASFGEVVFHNSGGYRFRPTRKAIVAALEKAHERRRDAELRANAREKALRYEAKMVYNQYWIPLIAEIESQVKEAVIAPE